MLDNRKENELAKTLVGKTVEDVHVEDGSLIVTFKDKTELAVAMRNGAVNDIECAQVNIGSGTIYLYPPFEP